MSVKLTNGQLWAVKKVSSASARERMFGVDVALICGVGLTFGVAVCRCTAIVMADIVHNQKANNANKGKDGFFKHKLNRADSRRCRIPRQPSGRI